MYVAKRSGAARNTCRHADTWERHVERRWELAAPEGIIKAGGGGLGTCPESRERRSDGLENREEPRGNPDILELNLLPLLSGWDSEYRSLSWNVPRPEDEASS